MYSNNLKKQFEPSALTTELKDVLLKTLRLLGSADFAEKALSLRKHSNRSQLDELDGVQKLDDLRLQVCYSLLADFSEQGWEITLEDEKIFVSVPSIKQEKNQTVDDVKNRLKKGFQSISDRQLAEPSNQKFIFSIESEREYKGRKVSVHSLIDDGKELNSIFSSIKGQTDDDAVEFIRGVIQPEIVECRGDEKCPHTGIRLQDIWRYFRHTWSLEYKLLPGRTLRLLVRNTARPNHPIIGIVLLASPTANLKSRDKWIGWTLDKVVEGLLNKKWSAKNVGTALFASIKQSISDIRTDDLIPPNALNYPKLQHIFQLEQIASKAFEARKRDLENPIEDKLIDIRSLSKAKLKNSDWKKLSETALFKKKRAEQLVPLLRALIVMKKYGFDTEPGAALYESLLDANGKKIVQIALNEIKKRRLASEVADLSVCGAVAPYNELIGGKLVTALMASKELSHIYEDRYGGQVSEIASQISGRRVVRSTELKLLTTTALYGIGSNQYSSLTLRKSRFHGLENDLIWKKLDSSEGFTVTHISDTTVALMREMSIVFYGRRRINSVFGEGSSPRTRQIRDGLNLIGIQNDELLRQMNKKKVYGCEMHPLAKETLLGFNEADSKRKLNSVPEITKSWISRWALNRLRKETTLAKLQKHNNNTISISLKSGAAHFALLGD